MSQERPKTPDFGLLGQPEPHVPGHFVPDFEQAQAPEPQEEVRLVAVKAPFDKRAPLPADIEIIDLSDDDEDRPLAQVQAVDKKLRWIKKENEPLYDKNGLLNLGPRSCYNEGIKEPDCHKTFQFHDWHNHEIDPIDEDRPPAKKRLQVPVEHEVLQPPEPLPALPIAAPVAADDSSSDSSSDQEDAIDEEDALEHLNYVHSIQQKSTTPTSTSTPASTSTSTKKRKTVVESDDEPIQPAPSSSSKKPRKTVVFEEEKDYDPHYHLEGLLALTDKKKRDTGDYLREFKGFVSEKPIPAGFIDAHDGKQILQSLEDPLMDFDCSLVATPIDYPGGREKIAYDFNLTIKTDLALSPHAFFMKLMSVINHRTSIIYEQSLGIRGAKVEGTSVKEIKEASRERFMEEKERKRPYSASDEEDFEDPKGKKKSKRGD